MNVEIREPSCTIGGNVNQCSHCGNQDGDSSKNYNRAATQLGNPTS